MLIRISLIVAIIAGLAVGTLNFIETIQSDINNPDKVVMTGDIGNPAKHVTGTWTIADGGSFVDTDGTKRCFNAQLQDVVPCN